MDRKAEEEPIAELLATTTTPRGPARLPIPLHGGRAAGWGFAGHTLVETHVLSVRASSAGQTGPAGKQLGSPLRRQSNRYSSGPPAERLELSESGPARGAPAQKPEDPK